MPRPPLQEEPEPITPSGGRLTSWRLQASISVSWRRDDDAEDEEDAAAEADHEDELNSPSMGTHE